MINIEGLKVFPGTYKLIKEMRRYKFKSIKSKPLDETGTLLYEALKASQWWKEL